MQTPVKNKNSNNSLVELNLNDLFILRKLEENLLGELQASYEKEATISDDLLESLYFLYKNPLFEALNQIDKYLESNNDDPKDAVLIVSAAATANSKPKSSPPVTRIKCEQSNQQLYQVKGSMDVNYYLFEALNFCTCSSFKYNVLARFDYFYCKHIIMVKLLLAMNKVDEKVVKQTDMIELIQQIQ